jgi:phage terminase small subunit
MRRFVRRSTMDFDRKQQKFIDLCVHMEDPTGAAVGAGYPQEHGMQLYANPQIRAEIDRKRAIVSTKVAELRAERQITVKPRKLPARTGSSKKRSEP